MLLVLILIVILTVCNFLPNMLTYQSHELPEGDQLLRPQHIEAIIIKKYCVIDFLLLCFRAS